MRDLKGPQFLHVVTTKGKGYAPAEADPITWHGPGPFDPLTGTIFKEKPPARPTRRCSATGCATWPTHDPRIIAHHAGDARRIGPRGIPKRFPDRYFDVAIAEQHAVTFAAGLACEGAKPVVAIYSTFLQRGYDQLIHDVALQNLPVVFALDRAGLVGGDGATHQGSFDLSFLRCIPNLVVMAPADENECRQMLYTATTLKQPAAVRYPRGGRDRASRSKTMTALPRGHGATAPRGRERPGAAVLRHDAGAGGVAERLDATVVNMRFVKPLDVELLRELAENHSRIHHARGKRRRRRRR